MKPTKCPAKETKLRQAKRYKRRGEKVKHKSQDDCVTSKPKNNAVYLEILLSAHAQTSQGNNITLPPSDPDANSNFIWIRRPRSEQPVNDFMASFSQGPMG